MPRKTKKRKKSKNQNPSQSHYFDADHIIAYLYKEEKERHDSIRKFLHNPNFISSRDVIIIFPQVAIGEVINAIVRKEEKEDIICKKIQELTNLIVKIGADIQPIKKEALNIALKCIDKEDRLTSLNDAIIFAQALVDENHTKLYTYDSILISSTILDEIAREERKEKGIKTNFKVTNVSES